MGHWVSGSVELRFAGRQGGVDPMALEKYPNTLWEKWDILGESQKHPALYNLWAISEMGVWFVGFSEAVFGA